MCAYSTVIIWMQSWSEKAHSSVAHDLVRTGSSSLSRSVLCAQLCYLACGGSATCAAALWPGCIWKRWVSCKPWDLYNLYLFKNSQSMCCVWVGYWKFSWRSGPATLLSMQVSLNVRVSTSEELYWLFGPCALSGAAIGRYPVEGKNEASVCDAVPSILVKSCL